VTYKLNLKNYIYNYGIYILNLVADLLASSFAIALFLVVPEGLKFIQVHTEALAVMVAVTADFMFNHWDPSILSYSTHTVVHRPPCPVTGIALLFTIIAMTTSNSIMKVCLSLINGINVQILFLRFTDMLSAFSFQNG
jgi:hypothetical protein